MLRLERRKDSGIWRIRGTHHGRHIDRSARTRSRAEADQIREKIERDIFAQVYGLRPETGEQTGRVTFAAAALQYMKSGGGAAYNMSRVIAVMGHVALDDITQGLIDRAALENFPDVTDSTRLRNFYAPVGAVLNFAQGERMMSAFKMRRPRPNRVRTDFRTPQEAEDLIAVMRGMAPLTIFLFGTGARIGEACKLLWKDISPDATHATFWDPKSTRGTTPPRTITLCARTRGALPPRGRPNDIVFRNDAGQPWAQTGNDGFHGPRLKMVRLCQMHGLPHTTPHMCRHSWASWENACNPDLVRLMQLGGWKSLSLVQRYTHTGTPDLAKQVKRFGWKQYGQNLGNKIA